MYILKIEQKREETAEDNPNCITRWQVKPEVRVGDMIVMYHRRRVRDRENK